jgi:nicotinamidase/pyrazinamidase
MEAAAACAAGRPPPATIPPSMKAFIVVDVQNDFCPGGSLAVAGGDEVVAVINAHRKDFALTVFTQDWHPPGHRSFASSNPGSQPFQVVRQGGADQVLWPDHCVQGSRGAEFHPALERHAGDPVFRKGEDPGIDSYSAFLDNDRKRETGLRQFLQQKGVSEVFVAGLATDVCVKYTVLDALTFGLKVSVYRAGCRAVNLRPQDEADAYLAMERAGAVLLP